MKMFFLLFLSLILFNCTKDSNKMQLFLYEKGKSVKLDNSELNLEKIETILKELVKNADEFLRLYMDEERFHTLKKEEALVEIILNEEIILFTKQLGELKFKRVLIPLTGDFIGNEKNPFITIFIGDDTYFPEPISNNSGFDELTKLKKELEVQSK